MNNMNNWILAAAAHSKKLEKYREWKEEKCKCNQILKV